MRSNHTVCVAALGALLITLTGAADAARGRADADARVEPSSHANATLAAAKSAEELASHIYGGLPDGELDAALAQLASAPRADALGVLEALSAHRRSGARRLAMQALEALAAADAASRDRALTLLARGLRDSDDAVRAIGARALGRHGSAAHGELLVRAFERGVPEAAAALGRVGDEALLARVHAQLGTQPLAVMLDGYDAWLARHDLSEAAKLEVVARLGEVAVPQVKTFLQRLIAEKRFAKAPRVQTAVIATAKRIAAAAAPPGTSTRPSTPPRSEAP